MSQKLAVVETLFDMNLLDVPGHLRGMADEIEQGKHGDVRSFIGVMHHDVDGRTHLEVFGWGKHADPALVVCLLERGAELTRKIALREDE